MSVTPTSSAAHVVELASGVDALYLSGRADLSAALVEALEERRATAVEAGVAVPFSVGGVEFMVKGQAFGKHRFCLDHQWGRIGVTASERLPTFRVQPRAEHLRGVGPEASLGFFEDIGERMAAGPVEWKLSRLDLFCDVQGWGLVGDDRHDFVCRSASRDLHEVGEAFTGFEFGQRSTGTVCARIYDKTAQVKAKGIDWWPSVWGARFDPQRPVLRVEFELNRQGLREFGIDAPRHGLADAGRLWASVTEDWLTYRTPTTDQTRSRWPVTPEWAAVQRASLRGDAIGLPRVRAGARHGSIRKLTPQMVGYLVSLGAILGLPDLGSTLAAARHLVEADELRRGISFEDRLAERIAELDR